VFAARRASSPTSDVRVRQALNYCFDRAGMVELLSGTAEASVSFFKPEDPRFGAPQNRYRLDPARGRALLTEAGYGAQRPPMPEDRDLAFGLRPDAAAPDEQVFAAEPARELRRRDQL
jgi:ABC-type transport system substrate-binding protein